MWRRLRPKVWEIARVHNVRRIKFEDDGIALHRHLQTFSVGVCSVSAPFTHRSRLGKDELTHPESDTI